MTDLENDTPLQLTDRQGVSDGFRVKGDYDPKLAIERKGLVIVELKRNPQEEFEIQFVNKRDHLGKPAIINLNLTGLFDHVQACRTSWEEGLESLTTMRPDPTDAGEKPDNPYENTWDKPVDAATFKKLAGKLAVAGGRLFRGIFERNRRTQLDYVAATLREVARSGECALTVYASEFHIPWRMLYTHPHETEELAEDGANFDPAGFWGYQHVIEQFIKPGDDIRSYVVASNGKLGFGAALHERIDAEFKVECIKRHHDFIHASMNQLIYAEWTTKAQLIKGLEAESFKQQVLYFLCHAEGAGTTAMPTLPPPFLQLTDGIKITAVEVRNSVCNRFEPSPPLIFINACRGGQLATLVRLNFTFAGELLEQGAVCVVGPQIEVPAVFAGEFGKRFFERFIAQTTPPPLVGSVLRDLTREMWQTHNPFGLVYSLYAGADCHIRWSNEGIA
jgi:CHAT domain